MDERRRDFIKMLITGQTMSANEEANVVQSREDENEERTSKHRDHQQRRQHRGEDGDGGGGRQRMPRQDSRTLRLHRKNSDERTATYWPKECGNKAVQELDGNFFESFTALVWKQENRRRRVASQDEKEARDPPPSESQLGPRQKIQPLSRKEFALLYIEVLYTIKHKIGATSGGHLPFIHDLYVYAQEAFGVTPEEHARYLAKASEEKPPILILNLVIIEARDLEAKDADGFSDPYCMMGIIPGSRAMKERLTDGSLGTSQSSDDEMKPRKESALKKFSQSFKKKSDSKTVRDMIPVKFIRTSTVKNNTLNPVWNEKFRFDLEDPTKDRLHLDIWDHDDEFSVVDAAKTLNEVQGLKGLGRYFKQIAQSARSGGNKTNVDDFLGSVSIRLDNIPSTGVSLWHDLEARSSRSNVEGQIHLELSLATREDRGYSEEDNWNDIQQHEDLIGIFIDYEMRKFKYEVFRWTGELSKAATTILHQHAIQGDITDVQQAMCRWSAYSKKHRVQPFEWSTLLKLLDDLHEKWEPASLSRDEEEILGRSFTEFISYSLGLIARQREVYPPANKAAQCRLEFMLKCLLKIHSMDVFRQCCPFQPNLQTDITAVLKKSTSEWYGGLHRRRKSVQQHDDDTLTELILLANVVNSDLSKALQYYSPLYERVLQMDYFAIIYKQLEKMIGDDVMKHLNEKTLSSLDTAEVHMENISAQQMGMQLFELYLALQEFCDMKEHLCAKDQENLSITQYYEWYKIPMQRWIDMSKFKAMQRIKRAVELDKVGQVDGHIKQSTSAVDVACCFGQIIDFWRKISWPDPVGALPFVSQITKDLCEGATYYADLIHTKLQAAGYYDEVGQFDVTEQLCITINDIEQVRRSLKPLPEALHFSDIIFATEKQRGETSAKQARGALCGTVRAADEEMIHKIKQVVDRVAGKMRPDIKKDVFHLCWAPEKQPPEEAISDLLNYLDSNLVTLNTNLLSSNFKRILDSIWVEVLEEIADVLETEDGKMTYFFERLFDALEILVDFFHANEKGLSMAAIKNHQFEDLHWQLTLNKAETTDVIEAYYLEKLHEQDQCEASAYGNLSVRLYYNAESEILLVEVLNAKNVLALDPNGLSDPFVLIELAPHHVFPTHTIQQTQVVKNTLNPTFDASFEFSLTRHQCKRPGACVVFTVMDHDFMLSNDFAGEAFFSLHKVPGVAKGEQISGFMALKPVSLVLTQPSRGEKTRASAAIVALQLRDWDKEAQEFVKKRRQLEAQAKS